MVGLLFDVVRCSRLHDVLSCHRSASRKVYYTTDIDRTESGAVQFHEDKTGARVTLQSSEIVEISKGTYRDGIRQ